MADLLLCRCWVCWWVVMGYWISLEALKQVDWSFSACEEPPPVPNAYRDVIKGCDVNYTCYAGYDVTGGDLLRHCQENGSYTGTEPICVLKCPWPVTPENLVPFVENHLHSGTAGDRIPAFCSYPISYGDSSTVNVITCSEQLGQWEPWSLFCAHYVETTNIHLSSEGNTNNTCWTTKAEVRPYWTADFVTSNPLELYDVAAVLLVVGDSSKDNVTLSIDIISNVTQPCGDVIPQQQEIQTTLICDNVPAYAPFGRGIRITASFTDNIPQQLELCKVTLHGRIHLGQCSAPPAIPRLQWTTQQSLFWTGDTVVYSCHHHLFPLSGSGLSQCTSAGQWTNPTLTCIDKENMASGSVVTVLRKRGGWFVPKELMALTDDDVTSGVRPGSHDIMYRVHLGQLVEVYEVTLSSLDVLNVTVDVFNNVTGCARPCEVIEYQETLTSVACPQMFVGDAVDVSFVTSEAKLTEVRVFGRVYDKPLSCLRSPSGEDYKGNVSMTTSGRSCQSWSDVISAIPTFQADLLPDESLKDAGNFCRNPGGDYSGVMCYVMDDAMSLQEEMCYVPLCTSYCHIRPDGQDYTGTVNVTADGLACVNWDHPHIRFRRQEDFDWLTGHGRAHNYCRNPAGSQSGLWCYTNTNTLDYGFCDIPFCGTDEMAVFSTSTLKSTMSSTTHSQTSSTSQASHDDITSTASQTSPDVTVSSSLSQASSPNTRVMYDATISPSYITFSTTYTPYDVSNTTSHQPPGAVHSHDVNAVSSVTDVSDGILEETMFQTMMSSQSVFESIAISPPLSSVHNLKTSSLPYTRESTLPYMDESTPVLQSSYIARIERESTDVSDGILEETMLQTMSSQSVFKSVVISRPFPFAHDVKTPSLPYIRESTLPYMDESTPVLQSSYTATTDTESQTDVLLTTTTTDSSPNNIQTSFLAEAVETSFSTRRYVERDNVDQFDTVFFTDTSSASTLSFTAMVSSSCIDVGVSPLTKILPIFTLSHSTLVTQSSNGFADIIYSSKTSPLTPSQSTSTAQSTSYIHHSLLLQYSLTPPPRVNTTNPPSPLKASSLCPCACAFQKPRPDVNENQSLSSKLQTLRSKLLVSKDTLSSTIRRKTSAPDHRKLSIATGIMAILLMVLLGLVLVAADAISVVKFCLDVVTKRKTARSF